jgi:hypothetical protein
VMPFSGSSTSLLPTTALSRQSSSISLRDSVIPTTRQDATEATTAPMRQIIPRASREPVSLTEANTDQRYESAALGPLREDSKEVSAPSDPAT